MNFLISSIVLLAVIMIIIYILSIDNNADKIKNKFVEIFSVVKSKKINYLNDKDNKNLLLYIKQHFKSDDNIIIPTKIYYNKTNNGYEMNDINIICYKYNNNKFEEIPYNINILFVPFEKDNYISNQTLLGSHGHYLLNIVDNKKSKNSLSSSSSSVKSVQFNNNDTFIPTKQYNDNIETYTDILDMIPDIIHLSETEENIDELLTTDTEQLISHNLK